MSIPNFLRSPRSSTVAPSTTDAGTTIYRGSVVSGGDASQGYPSSNNLVAQQHQLQNGGGPPAPMPNPVASYSPEERIFHQTFPFVPLSEKVVEHYQCSVSRSKVIRIGKLYLTALRMCFVSSFLKEPIHLPWDSVSSIEKKSNFLFEMIVVKRTAAAVQLQAEMDLDAKESRNNRRSIAAAADASGGLSSPGGGGAETPRLRANSAFLQTAGPNGTSVDISEVSTGGAGDEESFTGFITGSSDAAFRMMTMLHSVRARYRRSAAEALGSNNNNNNNTSNSSANAANTNDESGAMAMGSPIAGGGVGSPANGVSPRSTNLVMASEGARSSHHAAETMLSLDGDGDLPLTNASLTVTPSSVARQQHSAATDDSADHTTPKRTSALSAGSGGGGGTSPAHASLNGPSSFTTSPALSGAGGSNPPPIAALPIPQSGNSGNANSVNNKQHTAAGIVGVGDTPDIIAAATTNKEYATAARASVVMTNANDHIVLQSNLQRAMLTDEQRRKLERGHQRTSSASSVGLGGGAGAGGQPLDPVASAIAAAAVVANSAGGTISGEDFSQHESILKFFPYVPRSEIVVDQFQCSYAIGVHRIGRLYITGNYLLFSSHFMSDPIIIRLVDIERVEKLTSIMVLDGFNVHLRPEAARLTVGQICAAGGIVPACAIRAGMMTTNPAEGMTGAPVEGAAALAAAANAAAVTAVSGSVTPHVNSPALASAAVSNGSLAGGVAPFDPTTAAIDAHNATTNSGGSGPDSRSSSLQVRAGTSHASGATPGVSPPLSPHGAPFGSPFGGAAGAASGPMPFLAAGLPQSSPHMANVSPAYSKTTYTFTSFVGSRDQAFGILQHFCQGHSERVAAVAPRCPVPPEDAADKEKKSKEKKKTDEPAAAAAATAAVAEEVATLSVASPTAAAAPAAAVALAAAAPAVAVDAINACGRSWTSFRTKTSKPHFYNTFIPATSQDDFAKITTDFAGGLSDVPHFFSKEAKELIAPLKLPQGMDLLDVFYHCFDDDHEILGRYHEDRRDTGQSWEPWRAHLSAGALSGKEDCGAGAPNGLGAGQREMKSKTVIRVVGEKICDYNEFQRYAFFTLDGGKRRMLMVQVSGQAQGAMFSDSFRAETLMIFEESYVGAPVGLTSPPADAPNPMPSDTYFNPNRANTVVTMRCYGYINFLRSVWVRGKILSAALGTEMPECYKTLSGMMAKRLTEVAGQQRARAAAATAAAAASAVVAGGAPVVVAAPMPAAEATIAAPAVAEEVAAAPEENHSHAAGAGAGAAAPTAVLAVGGGGSIRDYLRPHNLFGFLCPADDPKKVPIAALAPAAALVVVLFLYSLSALLGALLFGGGELPSVAAARAVVAAQRQAAAQQMLAATGGSAAGGDSTALLGSEESDAVSVAAAAAISDVYNAAVRPLLVLVYGVATLLFGALGTEYALAAKDGLGL